MWADDAYDHIFTLTANRQLVANVDHIKPDGTLQVTIYEPNSKAADASLNRDLVAAGLAYVPTKLDGFRQAYPDKIAALEKTMQEAKDDRLAMWKYGDSTPDED
jgi:staphylococcal nuclease domain-containing protein 1